MVFDEQKIKEEVMSIISTLVTENGVANAPKESN